MADLAFVITRNLREPDPAAIVRAAARLGIPLKHEPGVSPLSFTFPDGGSFIATFVEAPHPDAATMGSGPTSPSREDVASAGTHLILAALGLEGDVRGRDIQMAGLTAAVIESTEAVGAMLGHGVIFHKAQLFSDLAALAVEEGELPIEIVVDVTIAPEPKDRMSFLTYGMERYGREELYLTCHVRGKGALGFLYDLVRWMLTDTKHEFPTGHTIGRSETERLVVQRVESPIGRDKNVIRLDLPDES